MPRMIKFCIPLLAVTVAAYFTYFYRYQNPPFFFWDENYHVAHAQKYLNGVYFMEPHPPLGKMLIALGEKLLQANEKNDQFMGTDYGRILPPGFSFAGYRLFPALLSWLGAPVLYLTLLLLIGSPVWAMLISFLYVFDNALLVHSRGAMLESPQIFFYLCSLLSFMILVRHGEARRWFWAGALGLGISFAGVVSIKINGLILVLLWPALGVLWRRQTRKLLHFFLASFCSFAVIYLGIWYIHFAIGHKVVASLPDKGFYQASPEYREFLAQGKTASLLALPIMLRDSFKFVGHYERGVPSLNLCKSEENGSPFFLWPVGSRTINYRWERNNNRTKYLYLVPNPAVWLASLVGVLGTIGILFGYLFLPLKSQPKQPVLALTFLLMYAGYMAAMGWLGRVMYLYHYFLPLILGFLMLAVVIYEVDRIARLTLGAFHKTLLLALTAALAIVAFDYFSPLTYYRPLSDAALQGRAWLKLWDLRCPSCKLSNGIAAPVCDPKVKPSPDLYITGIRAESGVQDWGEPKTDRSVEDQELFFSGVKYERGLGMHANASFKFPTRREFSRFTALVGVPDYVLQKSTPGSVTFEVLADGRSVWKSPVMHAGEQPVAVDVPIQGVNVVTLQVGDAGDGIDNDHACWAKPEFVK